MEYAHPEVLVDTNWVDQHKNDPKVRVAEVDYDPTANYDVRSRTRFSSHRLES